MELQHTQLGDDTDENKKKTEMFEVPLLENTTRTEIALEPTWLEPKQLRTHPN